MIADFLNREVVLAHLDMIRDDLKKTPDANSGALLAELDAAQSREEETSSGQIGFDLDDRRSAGAAPSMDEQVFLSRDPMVSLLQSALDEWAVENADVITEKAPEAAHGDRRSVESGGIMITNQRLAKPPAIRKVDDRRLLDQFSTTDVRWVRSLMASAVTKFRGKHAFNPEPAKPVVLPSRARLVIVGDWGSGLPRAQKVAARMREVIDEGIESDLTQHVVHLGDVYYSGWPKEYQRRFLPYWPVKTEEADRIGSWSTNSNHDMYCGGYGYFDTMLADPRFAAQSKSSFFNFVHPNWNIAALDTAWDEGELHGPQVQWLTDIMSDKSRKTLLMSHHQLFSAYESNSEKLATQLDPLLKGRGIDAWFWGHEHRCIFYEPHQNVQVARCIGHGGVPVYMNHREDDPMPNPGKYEYRSFFKRGLERWAMFGFAVLDFDGARISVRYINEDGGVPHDTETIG
jgi:Calcineurin-like phosphoesterase